MPTTTEPTETRPFHESIVNAILIADENQMRILAVLIKRTTIPTGHEEIIAAWNQRARIYSKIFAPDLALIVTTSLLAQKNAAAQKAGGTEKGISLDELQKEVERLSTMLKHRAPAVGAWCNALHERMTNVHRLISTYLGK